MDQIQKVPIAEYGEDGERKVIGEAYVEVEFKDGRFVVRDAIIHCADNKLSWMFFKNELHPYMICPPDPFMRRSSTAIGQIFRGFFDLFRRKATR